MATKSHFFNYFFFELKAVEILMFSIILPKSIKNFNIISFDFIHLAKSWTVTNGQMVHGNFMIA